MGIKLDLKGQRFSRLMVVSPAPNRGKHSLWNCICDCGNTAAVYTHSLRDGTTRSCGCYQKESAAKSIALSVTTHGMRRSPEYSVWSGMKRRCENPNEKSYARYGALGIKVCFKSFEEFFDDVGPRPSAAHSIDRIDTSGDYIAGNLRWATVTQQNRNRRDTFIVSIGGVSKSLAAWCEEQEVPYHRTWKLIRKKGWDPARALGISTDHQAANIGGLFGER